MVIDRKTGLGFCLVISSSSQPVPETLTVAAGTGDLTLCACAGQRGRSIKAGPSWQHRG